MIPNLPESAEAYYAPDSLHVIAQTQDPEAVAPSSARAAGGALTYTFKDTGEDIRRINDHGQGRMQLLFPGYVSIGLDVDPRQSTPPRR